MAFETAWIALSAPFLGALGIACLPRRAHGAASLVGAAASAVSTAILIGIASAAGGETVRVPLAWIPSLGVDADLLLDGFSLAFGILVTGIGLLVFLYGRAYMGDDPGRKRFFLTLLLFLGSMLGIVLSANLVTLFVFWELTTVTSFLLIGFRNERPEARAGALKSLVVTASGGLALLAGIVLLGIVGGSFDLVELRSEATRIHESPLYAWILGLVLLGAFTKSAQWPFHIWLPDAMEAPTPVSAYLHSATMVKAGLVLVARLLPILGGTPEWTYVVTTVGLVTVVWGAARAIPQDDLKRLLAFSTVSQLGIIMALFGLGTPAAVAAGFWHLVNHAAFKGALFMLAGIVDHEAGTRLRSRLAPLRTIMPRTGAAIAVAALSMAGVPLLGGFVSKEMAIGAFLHDGGAAGWLGVGVLAAGSVLTVVYSLLLAHSAYVRGGEGAGPGHDPGWGFLGPPLVLVGASVVLGLAPGIADGVAGAASSAIAARSLPVHLAIWHGFEPALGVSAIILAAGLGIYATGAFGRRIALPFSWDGVYEKALDGLDHGSRVLTTAYMTGKLRYYLIGLLAAFLVGQVLAWVSEGASFSMVAPAGEIGIPEAIVVTAVVCFGIATARAPTRLAAVVALGGIGFGLSLLFVFLGAPDLALTQLLVETVSVVLFLSVFVYLPVYRPSPFGLGSRTVRKVGCSIVGAVVSLLVYGALQQRSMEPISDYFLENSVSLAGGRNVVNVILVDFRGLDTLGEITVLGVAALGVFALVALRLERRA